MERIVSHIEYLLDHHECVIIPGFGAFIKRYEPAKIDTSRNVITAPRHSISFNSALKHDDGLLASSYARSIEIPYTTANATLAEDIAILKSQLSNNGETSIGKIGTLNSNRDGLLTFDPTDSTYVNSGLRDIKTNIGGTDDREDKVKISEPPRQYDRAIHRLMRYAAMLVILLGVGIVLSTPLATPGRETIVKASVCPIDTEGPKADMTEEIHPDLLISAPRVEEAEPETPSDKYCLVIASLANIEQAHQFMAQAGDDAIGMFENNGRYRVYARTGASVADVADAGLEEKYPGAWPCAMTTE